jgi:hypothetical protein
LNHPNICTIYDAGEEGEQAFLAMEYVEGRPLRDLTSAGDLPVETVLRYGVQIADALAHAHARGIVHRDLKSANVMVTPEGRIKVLDFGLARKMSRAGVDETTLSHATAAGAVVGTLHYMAPEVLRGEPTDARGDVWALGVVLHEMCSGELPFRGHTGFEVSGAILKEPPTPLPSNVPPGLRTVIGRCLAKSPGERYQHAEEVRAALETLQSGGRIASPALTRRWALAATAAGIGAASLAGGAFFGAEVALSGQEQGSNRFAAFRKHRRRPSRGGFRQWPSPGHDHGDQPALSRSHRGDRAHLCPALPGWGSERCTGWERPEGRLCG